MPVKFEMNEGLAVVTVDYPPLNLFDSEVMDGLLAAFDEAERVSPRAMLLKAAGEHFGCGVNIKKAFVGVDSQQARSMFTKGMHGLRRMEELPFPVIGAVQGFCFAAGLELALRCDLLFAAKSATFAQVEQHIGATTYLGGVYLLAERCGPARAREICFTGDTYSAETFERWNIVNYVVEDNQLQDKALAFAQRVANGPTRAHNATKRMLRVALDSGTQAADSFLLDIGPPLFGSEDFQTGVASIVEHGSRNFRGKARFSGR